MSEENQIIAERRAKLAKLRELGPAFPNDFVRTDCAADLHARYGATEREALDKEQAQVAVAGRIMLKRVMGKASFATIQDGTGLGTIFHDEGEYPLNRAVLGGKHLYDGDDYVVSYVASNEVKDVAAALAPLTEAELRARYDLIDPDDYDGAQGEEDFKYTWGYFQSVRDLYKKAAADGRAVVFTVDQ